MELDVAIVDDDPQQLELLGDFLAIKSLGFRAPKLYPSAIQAVRAILKAPPDIAIIDLHMPEKSGIDCIKEIRRGNHRTKLVVLSADGDSKVVEEALAAGADGYIQKGASLEGLSQSLISLHRGTPQFSPDILRKLIENFRKPRKTVMPTEKLTKAEARIMALTVDGKSCKEVAAELGLSVQTVYSHNKRIFRKLGVSSRIEALAKFSSTSPKSSDESPGSKT